MLLNQKFIKTKKGQESSFCSPSLSVPGVGLEPTRPNGHKILSLACLPIPPSGQLPPKLVVALNVP